MSQGILRRDFMNRIMFTTGNASIFRAIQLLLRVLATTFPFDVIKYECKGRYLGKQKDSFMRFCYGRTILLLDVLYSNVTI